MSKKILSKSRLMRGIQCSKSLWLSVHRPEWERGADTATQMQFDEGNEVGDLAREQEGQGTLISKEYWDFEGAHKDTQMAIRNGDKIIFEASFLNEGFFARADILKKIRNEWHLIEVKKSTQVKDYHIQDSAVQAYIIEATGIKLKSISIRHINNQCEYPNLENLFTTVDVTKEVREVQPEIESKIKKLKKTVASDEPQISIGKHCSDPFDCTFKYQCWKDVPKQSIFDLPVIRSNRKWDLFEKGYVKISDLDPSDFTGLTQRAVKATKSEKPYIGKNSIKAHLNQWLWPLYFFDFETIGPAIPRYEKTNPYSQIPFQFSCHIWISEKSKKLDHFEYLHQDTTDPRSGIIEAMLKGLGTSGSIVAYNKAFEIGVIKKLAEFDKKNKSKLLKLIDRFVDPLPIFKESVYHPDFLGSFSIKYVAPALLGSKLSYEGLEIADGSSAQAWAEQILRGKIKGAELKKTIVHLLKYCQQDTLAMVELVKWLQTNKV
jgi:predicted RecB family nuclease